MRNKLCDNKSAGMVITGPKGIVMIKRKNYPQAYALPAGHCDGDSFNDCAVRETKEEVGIEVSSYEELWGGKINNPCKRLVGIFHDWRVYKARRWSGELKPATDAKEAFWASDEDLRRMAKRTEHFSEKYGISLDDVWLLTWAIFGDPQVPQVDSEWEQEMGLEPVWHYIFKKIGTL